MYSKQWSFILFRSSKRKNLSASPRLRAQLPTLLETQNSNHLPCNTTVVHLHGSSWPTCKSTRVNEECWWMPEWGSKPYRRYDQGRPWSEIVSLVNIMRLPIALFVRKTSRTSPRWLKARWKKITTKLKKGIQAWWDVDAADLMGAEDADKYEKEVLDTH